MYIIDNKLVGLYEVVGLELNVTMVYKLLLEIKNKINLDQTLEMQTSAALPGYQYVIEVRN